MISFCLMGDEDSKVLAHEHCNVVCTIEKSLQRECRIDIIEYLFFFNFYLFMIVRERERERQAEGEAGSIQGACSRTGSWVSRITPPAEGGPKPLSHWGCPLSIYLSIHTSSVCF